MKIIIQILKQKSKYILTFIIIVVICSSILSYIFLTYNQQLLKPELQNKHFAYNFTDVRNKQYQLDTHGELWKFKNVIGWIPSFDYQNAKDDFYKNSASYTEISPEYYQIKPDGRIASNIYNGDTNLISIAHSNNVKITPTVVSFNETDLHMLLSQDNIVANNNFIISEIIRNNYDGIDLDYESINLSDKDNFFKMIDDLTLKLHSLAKILSVSVVSQYKEDGYNSLIETRAVQDWKLLSKYADELRIMTYDYSSINIKGPVSPLFWVEQVLNYATNTIPLSKIILGQPLYGYAYGNTRYAYTYNEIKEILDAQKPIVTFNSDSNEKSLDFKKNNELRTLFYQDYETMLRRFNMIKQKNIGGISYWRLGGEDQNIYSALIKQR